MATYAIQKINDHKYLLKTDKEQYDDYDNDNEIVYETRSHVKAIRKSLKCTPIVRVVCIEGGQA